MKTIMKYKTHLTLGQKVLGGVFGGIYDFSFTKHKFVPIGLSLAQVCVKASGYVSN